MKRPSPSSTRHGRWATSQITPTPIQAGQWRGPSKRRGRGGRTAPGIGPFYRAGHGGARVYWCAKPRRGLSSLRFLYTLAMYLVTPIIVMRLLARGVRYRGYHRRWRERFGLFPAPGINGSLWVHAVSVGEVNAAEPLVKALMLAYPDAPLVVTTVTPTGSERVLQLFGESVHSVYLPYDLPFAVRSFPAQDPSAAGCHRGNGNLAQLVFRLSQAWHSPA